MRTGDLWDAGAVAYVHGNGFIQVDVPPTPSGKSRRLHVWGHPDIPRQTVPTPIHDHRFGFRSSVLVGRLFNIVVRPVPVRKDCATHRRYTVRRRQGVEDTKLMPTEEGEHEGEWVRVCPGHIELIEEGGIYFMSPQVFHESTTDRQSASLMRKTITVNGYQPIVLVPMGLEPDNVFDREVFGQRDLRRIVDEVLGDREFE